MMRFLTPDAEFDRYLVLDDTDDDIGDIITVLCEQTPRSRRFDCPCDLCDGGAA